MAELEAFLKVLQDTVAANKLSGSRVDRVKTSATSCFHEPATAKSILKLHTRASSSTKVSSLYLFDAVARHAKDAVKKHGAGHDAGDARAPPGSDAIDGTNEALVAGAAYFLSQAEQVASDIALDTMRSVGREQQEKVKKIVDIWMRAATFDTGMLKELQRNVERHAAGSSRQRESSSSGTTRKATASSAKRSTTPPGDPRDAKRRPPYPLPPSLGGDSRASTSSAGPSGAATAAAAAAAPVGLPANILALLGGSAASNSGTGAAAVAPSTNGSAAAPSFDLSQLNMLQQLAAPSHRPSPPPPLPALDVAQAAATGSMGRPAGPPPGPPPSRPPLPLTGRSRDGRSRSPSATTRGHNEARGSSASRWDSSSGGGGGGGGLAGGPPPRPGPAPSLPAPPRAPPPQTVPSLQPPRANAAAAEDTTTEDLSTLDLSTFDPTDAESWRRVGDAFENSYGYKPTNQQVMAVVMGFPPVGMGMGMGMMGMQPMGMMGGMPMGMGMGMGVGGGQGGMGWEGGASSTEGGQDGGGAAGYQQQGYGRGQEQRQTQHHQQPPNESGWGQGWRGAPRPPQ